MAASATSTTTKHQIFTRVTTQLEGNVPSHLEAIKQLGKSRESMETKNIALRCGHSMYGGMTIEEIIQKYGTGGFIKKGKEELAKLKAALEELDSTNPESLGVIQQFETLSKIKDSSDSGAVDSEKNEIPAGQYCTKQLVTLREMAQTYKNLIALFEKKIADCVYSEKNEAKDQARQATKWWYQSAKGAVQWLTGVNDEKEALTPPQLTATSRAAYDAPESTANHNSAIIFKRIRDVANRCMEGWVNQQLERNANGYEIQFYTQLATAGRVLEIDGKHIDALVMGAYSSLQEARKQFKGSEDLENPSLLEFHRKVAEQAAAFEKSAPTMTAGEVQYRKERVEYLRTLESTLSIVLNRFKDRIERGERAANEYFTEQSLEFGSIRETKAELIKREAFETELQTVTDELHNLLMELDRLEIDDLLLPNQLGDLQIEDGSATDSDETRKRSASESDLAAVTTEEAVSATSRSVEDITAAMNTLDIETEGSQVANPEKEKNPLLVMKEKLAAQIEAKRQQILNALQIRKNEYEASTLASIDLAEQLNQALEERGQPKETVEIFTAFGDVNVAADALTLGKQLKDSPSPVDLTDLQSRVDALKKEKQRALEELQGVVQAYSDSVTSYDKLMRRLNANLAELSQPEEEVNTYPSFELDDEITYGRIEEVKASIPDIIDTDALLTRVRELEEQLNQEKKKLRTEVLSARDETQIVFDSLFAARTELNAYLTSNKLEDEKVEITSFELDDFDNLEGATLATLKEMQITLAAKKSGFEADLGLVQAKLEEAKKKVERS